MQGRGEIWKCICLYFFFERAVCVFTLSIGQLGASLCPACDMKCEVMDIRCVPLTKGRPNKVKLDSQSLWNREKR